MTKDELGDYLGQMVERGDGDVFGKVVMAERDGHGLALTCRVAGPGVGGAERRVTLVGPDFGAGGEWRLLGLPPENLPMAAPASCIRCRRINFGPCISATCLDLQVSR